MKKTVIGIDVSKEKLDVSILKETKIQEEAIIENQTKKITAYLKEVQKKNKEKIIFDKTDVEDAEYEEIK